MAQEAGDQLRVRGRRSIPITIIGVLCVLFGGLQAYESYGEYTKAEAKKEMADAWRQKANVLIDDGPGPDPLNPTTTRHYKQMNAIKKSAKVERERRAQIAYSAAIQHSIFALFHGILACLFLCGSKMVSRSKGGRFWGFLIGLGLYSVAGRAIYVLSEDAVLEATALVAPGSALLLGTTIIVLLASESGRRHFQTGES